MILGGLSFLLMVLPTSGHADDTYRMAAWWIVGSYLLLGLGDVLLETSGLSASSKLAPKAFASQTMALWFLSLAVANGIQAQVVKLYGGRPPRPPTSGSTARSPWRQDSR
ncbi:Peptide MFS transporter OS=Streptomyces microflavus OX=1919 GN=G3I39_19630 PE=3 SV=1 [Streptomyces microflavus]